MRFEPDPKEVAIPGPWRIVHRGEQMDEKERALVDAIVQASKVLNNAIQEGARAGLTVTLDVIDVTVIGYPQRRYMVSPTIERVVRLTGPEY
jgi:acetyl-CoA acetyltransferase